MYLLKNCRHFLSMALVFSLLLFGSGQAFGQVGAWNTPANISEAGQSAANPRVTLSDDGTKATAVWRRSNGSHNIIQSASATISGNIPTWSVPIDLSAVGEHASEGFVALSDDGTKAIAVWYRFDGANHIIQSATATISGNVATWSAAQDLSMVGQDAFIPRVALSSDGTKAIAVWYRSDGVDFIIQAATASITSNIATWSTAQDLSAAGQNADSPVVAMSDDGTKATVVWTRSNGSNTIVQSASATISSNTATWGTTSDLSAIGGSALSSRVALSADGSMATALWRRDDGEQRMQSASATISGNSASWGSATNLSEAGQSAVFPVITLSDDGTRATAAWYRTSGSYFSAQSASATISGNTADWSAFVEISTMGLNSYFVDIALSEDGTKALALWTSIDGPVPTDVEASSGKNIIQSSAGFISGKAAEWSTPEFRSDDSQDALIPRVALSSDGRWGTAVWIRSDGTNNLIQSSSVDLDLCPEDPDKVVPGSCGCGVAETDSDSDGTADCNDECDADATKTEAGICGCGIADTDSDGDSTADCNDECSTDANKSSAGDCGCGLPDTDSDTNGVSDCLDVSLNVSKTFVNKTSKKAIKKLRKQLKSQRSIARSLFNDGKISLKLFNEIKSKARRIKFLLLKSQNQSDSARRREAAKLSKAYNKRLKELQELLTA